MDADALTLIGDEVLRSAFDAEGWRRALDRITSATLSLGAAILPLEGRVPGSALTDSVAESFDLYHRDGWSARDLRALRGLPRLLQAGILVDQDFITPAQMAREPFYEELLRPVGLRWFAGVVVRADGDTWCLALQRTIGQGPFTPAEQAAIARLGRPLSRAATLARQMGDVSSGDLLAVLDGKGIAALMLDRWGRLVSLNGRAERHVPHDIDVRHGEVSTRHGLHAAQRLKRHVGAALWSAIDPASPDLAPVSIERAGKRPLIVQAQPLRGAAVEDFAQGRALLTILDLDDRTAPSDALLRQAFGLTTAQIRLLAALVATGHLPRAAEAIGVSHETARVHLKAVFEKTGTRGQGELMHLLGRLARP